MKQHKLQTKRDKDSKGSTYEAKYNESHNKTVNPQSKSKNENQIKKKDLVTSNVVNVLC